VRERRLRQGHRGVGLANDATVYLWPEGDLQADTGLTLPWTGGWRYDRTWTDARDKEQ
jgi:hypothetical protein